MQLGVRNVGRGQITRSVVVNLLAGIKFLTTGKKYLALQISPCVRHLIFIQHGDAAISEGNWHCKRTQVSGACHTNINHTLCFCIDPVRPALEERFGVVARCPIR